LSMLVMNSAANFSTSGDISLGSSCRILDKIFV
jgi:hypothetical protein